MDLISGYLIIILLLFPINIALFLGNYKINTSKLLLYSVTFFALSFGLIYMANYVSFNFLDCLSYYFIACSIIIFIDYIYYLKDSERHLKSSFFLIILLFFTSVFILSSQSDYYSLLTSLLFSLPVFITIFLVFQLTKLLVHAKRDYPVIIGEYMCLYAILIFIFGLTFYSTYVLDYSMFSSFLILTPTYQLVYIIIAFIVVVIIGLLYNDNRGIK